VERLACRLLPFDASDGPSNMATDQVMLESAAAGIASLRFYEWTEATLSLGYFQPAQLRETEERWQQLPFVRRPSGGQALVHDRELTYALALPAGHPWQHPAEPAGAWVPRVHGVIALALGSLGISTARATGISRCRACPFLCFQVPAPGDLMIGQHKVVGSAQRKRRGTFLQHGAVLLASSPFAPMLPGVSDLTGNKIALTDLADAIATELSRVTAWTLARTTWSLLESRRMRDLVMTRYADPTWNLRRWARSPLGPR
jgi:lipoate-protein ligase A